MRIPQHGLEVGLVGVTQCLVCMLCPQGGSYRELANFLIESSGVIPLGLRRSDSEVHSRSQQFVGTNPPASTILQAGDQVYILMPSPA